MKKYTTARNKKYKYILFTAVKLYLYNLKTKWWDYKPPSIYITVVGKSKQKVNKTTNVILLFLIRME